MADQRIGDAIIARRHARAAQLKPWNISLVLNKEKKTQAIHPGNLPDAFSIMERDAVDKKILMCMAANGVPFQIMCSHFFSEMVTAINNAPKAYKAPSSEKARTALLDACKRQVENDLPGVRDTWLTQGVSIVSSEWTNIKKTTAYQCDCVK